VRALVTGCAGFIGSHVTESLLADGHSVLGVDCFNDNYGRRRKLENLAGARDWATFAFVEADLAEGGLRPLVSGCDVVVHLAAEPGVRPSWGERFGTYLRNNIQATQNLLDAARSEPGLRFVNASSSSVYGDAEALPVTEEVLPRPLSPYGATKLAAEHLCGLYHDEHGVDAVSLRYFSVYGPRQRPDMAFSTFCDAALNGSPITVFGDGRQTRDFTFVDDVVAATRAAIDAPGIGGATFNVGGGSRTSVARTLEILAGLVHRPLNVRRVAPRPGEARDTAADTTAARIALGFSPAVTIEAGLQRQLAWAAGQDAGRPAGLSALA
jgi:UDP-glucose 4-epimerase